MEDSTKEEMMKIKKYFDEVDKETEKYPLAKYSTTQLKAELRRRKGKK